MSKDYYKSLNINRNATQDEVKKAFRKLSKTHHPDKGGDENTFKELSEAYDTLGNGPKRADYDNRLNNPFHGSQSHGHGHGPNMDDVFNQFFGGGNRRQHRHQQKKGRGLNIPLTISLEDVFFGGIKKLRYNREMKCGTCQGSGGVAPTCHVCNGQGFVEQMVGNAFFRQVKRENCNQCNGKGKIVVDPCKTCSGKGMLTTPNTVDFKIPSNLMTGQIYTFRRLGDDVENGEAGDLNIQVVIARHPKFKLVNMDIIYEVDISVLDMIVGTELEIPYFTGTINAKIPELSNLTQTFNLRGKGVNNDMGRGDLIIKLNVKMPKSLSEEDKKTLNKLKETIK